MKQLSAIKKIIAVLVMILISFKQLNAQTTPPLSPLDSASGTLKNGTHVKVVYSSPSVRERKIWGELVPYHKMWRAGANAATLIELDKDVKIDGNTLKAGKYSIYMTPEEENWVIIFSSQTGQAGLNNDGTTTLDFDKVVLRALATSKKSKNFNERLIYSINEKGMILSWEKLEVTLLMK
ncbi:MAG: DUF2911 domain-containing protein [Chitinophagaceae bacterium]|nr:DUF2911 domain-containing protein [Chitinophagaceae bacterium]